MSIPDQSQYTPVTELGSKGPMVSNLPLDHRAWLHPMQSYIWMHDIYNAGVDILGMIMPEVQQQRLRILSRVRFLEDHSGRGTGKTHNYLMDLAIRSICINMMDSIWLGQESEIGKEVLDKHLGAWVKHEPNFRRFVTAKGDRKAKISHTQGKALIMFHNGSSLNSLSPDPTRDYKKTQTMRKNHGIFNEWTSWPNIGDIENRIEPIFTNTNRPYRHTRLFRESMERITGVQLGRLTNENLYARHKSEDYIARDHMENCQPNSWAHISEKFHRNFEIAFGFDYRDGIANERLQFDPIRSTNDIVMFFRHYDEGDANYMNKLIYDGSAQKPSDECYAKHKSFEKKVKAGDHLYGIYRIGVDDIPSKWDGIIHESIIVEKARSKMLDETFKRVWLGFWTEGRAKNPFSWHEVMNACKEGWFGQLSRRDNNENFAGGIDSAQGTDATYKTDKGIKDGRGDDGIDVIWKMGDGTAENPHKLCYVYIAEDIRAEPMAYDIQEIDTRFGTDFYMFDPGGGGKGVLGALAKETLEKTDMDGQKMTIEVVPMLPWDHEAPRNSKTNICIFSLSNEMITAPYVDSRTGKALFQYGDQLNNFMVTLFQDALKDCTAQLPQQLDLEEIVGAHNEGRISDEQLLNLTDIRTAISQICHLRYETNRHGRRVKTGHGVFKYTSLGKKDAAWAVLMGYMMCDVITKMKAMLEDDDEDSSIMPDVN